MQNIHIILLSVAALALVVIVALLVNAALPHDPRKAKSAGAPMANYLGAFVTSSSNSLTVPSPISDPSAGGHWLIPNARFKRRTESITPLARSSGLLPTELYNGVYNVERSIESMDACRSSCLADPFCTAVEYDTTALTCVKSLYNPRVFLRTWGSNVCDPLGPLVCNSATTASATVEFLFRATLLIPLPASVPNCESACSSDAYLPHSPDWLGPDSYYYGTMCMGTLFNGVTNYSPACDINADNTATTPPTCICAMDPSRHRSLLSTDPLQQTAVNPATLVNDILFATSAAAAAATQQ